jgi:hypothetical protein
MTPNVIGAKYVWIFGNGIRHPVLPKSVFVLPLMVLWNVSYYNVKKENLFGT